jgi:cytochrome b
MNRQKGNWIIDSMLFVGFLVACWLDLTGVEVHQWIGMLIGAFAVFHLALHWSWVKSVTNRFFSQTSGQARIFYVIDSSLLLGFFLIVVTGLVISTWLALPLGNYDGLKSIHIIITAFTLVMIVLKIALHWRWVVTVGSRQIVRPVVSANNIQIASTRSSGLDRRAFLKLMGTVGMMAFIPTTNLIHAFTQESVQGKVSANSSTQPSTTVPLQTSVTSSQSVVTTAKNTTTTTCQVRCSKGCSAPGRCRRYVDSNKNNKCDLGECI